MQVEDLFWTPDLPENRCFTAAMQLYIHTDVRQAAYVAYRLSSVAIEGVLLVSMQLF